MKKRLLYISPHLSTGGLPQYLYKQILHFKNDYEIQVVEISDLGGDAFVVQKNKIKSIVPIHTLGSDKSGILKVIQNFNPHIIHFQEIPEFNLSNDILDKIFDNSRDYYIITSTHGSYTDPTQIKYHPDRYVLVSEWSRRKFEVTGVDTHIWEYPIEDYVFDKSEARKKLGFEDGWKHVLNVGLFAPGKNQKEIFQIAEKMKDYKIKFHFVGNQAMNFENYWKPLMETKPDNCIVWGERNDVDIFYQAADLFYFSSTLELNPLSIKEALSYKLPSFFRKLETYLDTYDNNKLVTYIDDNTEYTQKSLLDVLKLNNLNKDDDVLSIILTYPDDEYRKKLLRECVKSIPTETLISTHYQIDNDIFNIVDWVLYDKENPLLYKENFKKYDIVYKYWRTDEYGNRMEKDFDYEHSYTVYTLLRNALSYAKSIGKKYIHVINYDYLIPKNVLDSHREYFNDGYDVIFYKYDKTSYNLPAYCTGFFSGEVNTLLSFFSKCNTIDEFYKLFGNYTVLENRVHKYYNEGDFKIKELLFDDLESAAEVNREGVLEFSKMWDNKNV